MLVVKGRVQGVEGYIVSFLDLSLFPISFCGSLGFSSSSDVFYLRSFFRIMRMMTPSSVSTFQCLGFCYVFLYCFLSCHFRINFQ